MCWSLLPPVNGPPTSTVALPLLTSKTVMHPTEATTRALSRSLFPPVGVPPSRLLPTPSRLWSSMTLTTSGSLLSSTLLADTVRNSNPSGRLFRPSTSQISRSSSVSSTSLILTTWQSSRCSLVASQSAAPLLFSSTVTTRPCPRSTPVPGASPSSTPGS